MNYEIKWAKSTKKNRKKTRKKYCRECEIPADEAHPRNKCKDQGKLSLNQNNYRCHIISDGSLCVSPIYLVKIIFIYTHNCILTVCNKNVIICTIGFISSPKMCISTSHDHQPVTCRTGKQLLINERQSLTLQL